MTAEGGHDGRGGDGGGEAAMSVPATGPIGARSSLPLHIVMPAKAGILSERAVSPSSDVVPWKEMPAFAGMTAEGGRDGRGRA